VRVIGVDPGLTRAGWAVVDQHGSRLTAVGYGTFHAEGNDAPAQLASLHRRLGLAIAKHKPAAMSVERVFFNRNARTAIRVGQASGIALCAGAEARIPVFEYGPLEVKHAVVGVGDATKNQVGYMVQRILGLAESPDTPDAADALALAVCLLHNAPWTRAVEAVR
jgi:crossover junction endodeoxyribonuclease RuvC